MVPHLNELQEKYGDKGLTVIGVTGEGKNETEKWVADKGAHYAYGYDKGGKISSFFGVRGIPHAVLIDPNGTVVWSGGPGGLSDSMIEQHLQGALELPLWKWPEQAKKARQAVQKRQFAKALEEARALGDEGAKYVTAIESVVRGKAAGLEKAAQDADWLTVEERAKELEKELAGLPELEKVKSVLGQLKGDKQAQAVLAAQKEVRKLVSGKIKKGDIPKIEKKLKEIGAEFQGTGASRDADKALAKLRQ